MTAPIMPERARQIIEKVYGRHGFMLDEVSTLSRDDDVTQAVREARDALKKHYAAGDVRAWLGGKPAPVRDECAVQVTGDEDQNLLPAVLFSLWRGRIETRQPRRRMEDIAQEIADLYGLTTDDLIGPRRTQKFSVPRQHCMYLMAQQTHLSLPMIGRFLGGRDHTTVLHGVRVHAARLAAEWSEREAA